MTPLRVTIAAAFALLAVGGILAVAVPVPTVDVTTADGIDDAHACDADAQRLCPDQWTGTNVQASWKLDLVACLTASEDISVACRASLDRRQALNEKLVAACSTDRGEHCAGVEPAPGGEPMVDCLVAHAAELDAACREALLAHEAAKPR